MIFVSNNKLDKQTLRGVRRLSPNSAIDLDNLLNELQPVKSLIQKETCTNQAVSLWINKLSEEDSEDNEFESGVEGNKKQRFTTYYERLPENRKRAIKIHGVSCKACDFNFEENYGSHGKDFIHVHHIKPVSRFEKPKKINLQTDLTVVCPNCHSMIHRYKYKILTVEEVKSLIQQNL